MALTGSQVEQIATALSRVEMNLKSGQRSANAGAWDSAKTYADLAYSDYIGVKPLLPLASVDSVRIRLVQLYGSVYAYQAANDKAGLYQLFGQCVDAVMGLASGIEAGIVNVAKNVVGITNDVLSAWTDVQNAWGTLQSTVARAGGVPTALQSKYSSVASRYNAAASDVAKLQAAKSGWGTSGLGASYSSWKTWALIAFPPTTVLGLSVAGAGVAVEALRLLAVEVRALANEVSVAVFGKPLDQVGGIAGITDKLFYYGGMALLIGVGGYITFKYALPALKAKGKTQGALRTV